MTESRLENRASPITHHESVSGPVITKTAPTTTKLNASAKSFVFNTAAPAWTPSFATPALAAAAAPASTPAPVATAPVAAKPVAPSSPAIAPAAAPITAASPVLKAAAAPIAVASPKLKAEAKPFVPSFLAKPFVPSFTTPAPEPPAPAAAATAEDSPLAQPETTAASVETKCDATDAVATVVIGTETVSLEDATETTLETSTESSETIDTTEVESPAVVAEQAAIGARLLYSIAQLLELEPVVCPMPPSVMGLPVAAETTGKASNAFTAATASTEASSKSTRGHNNNSNNSRRNGSDAPSSSRSLHRTNSESSNRSGRNNNNNNSSRRNGNGRHHHNVHDTAPALEDCEPLAINEATRWKPKTRDASPTTTATDPSIDVLLDADAAAAVTDASLKEAKAILNKLSIEKFDKLSNELIAVAVRSVDVLVGVIEMIVSKAKMEWHFSTMYAELCTKMARTQMPSVVVPTTQAAAMSVGELDVDADAATVVVVEDTHKLFRRLLLQRCEREFREAPSRDGLDALAPDDAAEKELLLKRGVLGHIRFVGELFKLEMIKARIMHQCIANLFGDAPMQQRDEEALECLTKLLATIGDVFESTARSDGERAAIAQYYAVIKALATATRPLNKTDDADKPQLPPLSTRVRFMLQDLLELRKNRWVARREEAKATTIAQVHADAKREADAKARASAAGQSSSSSSHSARLQRSQSMHVASDRRRAANSTNGNGGASDAWKARAAAASHATTAAAAPAVDADGWETVASGRPRLVKSRSTTDRVPLAPPPQSTTNSNNNAGSRPPKSASQAPSTAAAAATKSRNSSGSSSSSTASLLRRGHSISDFGRSAAAASSSSSSRSSNKTVASATTTTTGPAAAAAPQQKQVSPAAFDEQLQSIFTDFCVTRDVDDAISCIQALAAPQHHVRIATYVLNVGLEKGQVQRTAAAEWLAALHARAVVTTDDLVTPLDELLEFAEDLEIDIPWTLTYVADMIAPSVASGALPLERVVTICQSHLAASGKAAAVIAKTLIAVGDNTKARALASAAELDLLPLLAASDRNDDALRAFCEAANVSFLLE